jgi:hypothetical protein
MRNAGPGRCARVLGLAADRRARPPSPTHRRGGAVNRRSSAARSARRGRPSPGFMRSGTNQTTVCNIFCTRHIAHLPLTQLTQHADDRPLRQLDLEVAVAVASRAGKQWMGHAADSASFPGRGSDTAVPAMPPDARPREPQGPGALSDVRNVNGQEAVCGTLRDSSSSTRPVISGWSGRWPLSRGPGRRVLHNFNPNGFESLYPRYRGGRPPTFILAQRRASKQLAPVASPGHDLRFSTRRLAKLKEFLVAEG